MPLVAIPNVSTGNASTLRGFEDIIRSAGAVVLDTHSDAVHDRSVLTVGGGVTALQRAMVALANAARRIDLGAQKGVHPRIGALDVCPFVPHEHTGIETAIDVARKTGELIAEHAGLPVYLYGEAATRSTTHLLSDLRRGGLTGLRARAEQGLPPDFGPTVVKESTGVVCVGAREVLIAFNVWLRCPLEGARSIASRVREAGGGLPGVRALGFPMGSDVAQVSMNLTAPAIAGIAEAFEAVDVEAQRLRVEVLATEIVGLPPERFQPPPLARATRLLREPGRSLETALAEAGL